MSITSVKRTLGFLRGFSSCEPVSVGLVGRGCLREDLTGSLAVLVEIGPGGAGWDGDILSVFTVRGRGAGTALVEMGKSFIPVGFGGARSALSRLFNSTLRRMERLGNSLGAFVESDMMSSNRWRVGFGLPLTKMLPVLERAGFLPSLPDFLALRGALTTLLVLGRSNDRAESSGRRVVAAWAEGLAVP